MSTDVSRKRNDGERILAVKCLFCQFQLNYCFIDSDEYLSEIKKEEEFDLSRNNLSPRAQYANTAVSISTKNTNY